MDEVDRIAAFEAEILEQRIKRMRQEVKPASELGASHCEDCGMDIPMARRKAIPSATRCVDCQEDLEGVS